MHARELELSDPKLHFHICALVVVNSMQTRAVHERMRLRAARCAAHVARTSTLFLQREGHMDVTFCLALFTSLLFSFLSCLLRCLMSNTTQLMLVVASRARAMQARQQFQQSM